MAQLADFRKIQPSRTDHSSMRVALARRSRHKRLAFGATIAAILLAGLAGMTVLVLPLTGFPGTWVTGLPWAAHPQSAEVGPQGAPWPVPEPTIRTCELWYATTPAPGVWAELKVVLDNPLPAGPGAPSRALLLVPGTLLEDFKIRSAEPKLLTQPTRRPDGRYALAFAAPIPESLNWYRLYLTVRTASPRPVQLAFMLGGGRSLPLMQPVPAQIFHTDRQADPFLAVPEPLVRWLPSHGRDAFPLLAAISAALCVLAIGGCVFAFKTIHR
ncbi:MAG TPA: hypothetical protein VGW38_05090 [Chloroflexota bacterium]|nr:hypothetical protein [Chloroflexota bacterium]